MVGGFSRPKKDKAIKVANGELVKAGEILARGMDSYKAGQNVRGLGTLFAICEGQVYFSRKKTNHGKMRTFINIRPVKTKAK